MWLRLKPSLLKMGRRPERTKPEPKRNDKGRDPRGTDTPVGSGRDVERRGRDKERRGAEGDRSRSRRRRGRKDKKEDKDHGGSKGKGKGPQSAAAATGESNLDVDIDIGGEMNGGVEGDFGLHLSQFAVHEQLAGACIAALDAGHRTDRCKLSSLPVFCGDMCAITSTAACYSQSKSASVVIGLANPIKYDAMVKANLNEQANSMLVSNLGKGLLRNIGSGTVLGLPCHTHLIPLIRECVDDEVPDFGDIDSMTDAIDLVQGVSYLVGDDEDDAVVLTAFKVVSCFYFWLLLSKRRNTPWNEVATELTCMFLGGQSPGATRLVASLERIYNEEMTATARAAFEKYIPLLSRDQMFTTMRDDAMFNFGLWAYPPFCNYIENVMRSDLDNHGVRWTKVKVPLQTDATARGYTLGSVLTLKVEHELDFQIYLQPRRNPVDYFSIQKLERKDVAIGVVYSMSLAFPANPNQMDFGWLNPDLNTITERRPVQNSTLWGSLGATFMH